MCFGNKSKPNGSDLNARPASAKPTQSYQPNNGVTAAIANNKPCASNAPYYDASESNSAPPLSGPPPAFTDEYNHYAPPPGPPPKQEPYHDWQTAVPDTSLLPPPPSLGNQRSATNNATEEEAEQGTDWCNANPLFGPVVLNHQSGNALSTGEIGVVVPRSFKGVLNRPQPGVWKGSSKKNCPDSCILSTVPLYSVYAHSPLQTNQPKTIYYEVKISPNNRTEVSLAIGYTAPPYPTFRLPGWHRGSLGVHGDDGSRFVNDTWGGRDFTAPFQPGETIGLGMTFSRNRDAQLPSYQGATNYDDTIKPIKVEVFLTKNGAKAGGWNLHEENDAVEDLPVTGLEGFHDLLAAVGTFEDVEFEIVFDPSKWLYRPY